MAACMMRQSDEKHILGTAATEILLWSSRRDLIAVSNSSGEVFLRRLSWSKVWKLAKKGDGVKVSSIVWRPDSEVLAVGYSSGEIVLVDVETGETIHSFNPCGESVTCLSWENNSFNINQETINNLLPKLLPLPQKVNSLKLENGANDDDQSMNHEENFSLLWIGLKNGKVFGYAFGMFQCCVLNLTELAGNHENVGAVRHICPNYDHSQLTIMADLCSSSEMLLMSVETPLVAHCLKELYILGVLYRQIFGLLDCLTSAQKALHEAWEDALVDLESKMLRYETNDGESSLSVDLMELLMFGHAGMKLERFLVNDLTDKGLKRIGQAVELSYSNMQKLLVKHIMCANYQLSHYLTQLCGLAKQEDHFSGLGLHLNTCQLANQAAGSFTAKTIELQQVIDGSVKYLKTFFRWLYVTILRLSDEPIPPELACSTQQDVRFIANFLAKDFETDGKVRLDRIGQYLRNEPLNFVASSKNRPWDLLIEACPSLGLLRETEMFQPHPESSLTQEFQQLEARVKASFKDVPLTVGQSAVLPFNIGVGMECSRDNFHQIRITSRTLSDKTNKDRCTLLAATESPGPSKGFYLFEHAVNDQKSSPRAAFFYFGKSDHLQQCDYSLSDIQIYNNEILSVLLTGTNSSVFLQLPINLLREELSTVVSRRGLISPDFVFVPSVLHSSSLHSVDASSYIEPTSFRIFPDFLGSTMGLSSSRKVAALFSSAKRKIRIFDMEVEEEEAEEEEIDDQPNDMSCISMMDKENRQDANDTDMAISP